MLSIRSPPVSTREALPLPRMANSTWRGLFQAIFFSALSGHLRYPLLRRMQHLTIRAEAEKKEITTILAGTSQTHFPLAGTPRCRRRSQPVKRKTTRATNTRSLQNNGWVSYDGVRGTHESNTSCDCGGVGARLRYKGPAIGGKREKRLRRLYARRPRVEVSPLYLHAV